MDSTVKKTNINAGIFMTENMLKSVFECLEVYTLAMFMVMKKFKTYMISF